VLARREKEKASEEEKGEGRGGGRTLQPKDQQVGMTGGHGPGRKEKRQRGKAGERGRDRASRRRSSDERKKGGRKRRGGRGGGEIVRRLPPISGCML